MISDTVEVVDAMRYLFSLVVLISVSTVVIAVLYYVVRGCRAVLHYASRRWWRW